MKQVTWKAICLWKAWGYAGNKRELQHNSVVSIGSLRKQDEPITYKAKITSLSPKRGH
jgi:hypothetical protein